jgi:hypothetical protein
VVAVRTLGLIVSSCGNVMGPYLEYPQLLSVLLRMLHEGLAAQRREVIKVGEQSWDLKYETRGRPARWQWGGRVGLQPRPRRGSR